MSNAPKKIVTAKTANKVTAMFEKATSDWRISDKKTISDLWNLSDQIDFDPPYQRQSNVWSPKKKRLFIDSIIQNYDIPKIYFHKYTDPITNKILIAIIDGKQRVQATFDFITGKLVLGNGVSFNDLSEKQRISFLSRSLDVVYFHSVSDRDIENQFYRLNNGEKLSAAEHRNTIGGDMCGIIRDVTTHKFFADYISAKDNRGAHKNLIANLCLIELDAITNKEFRPIARGKAALDNLVETNSHMDDKVKNALLLRLEAGLRQMVAVFPKRDPLLKLPSLVYVYYLFVRSMNLTYGCDNMPSKIHAFLSKFSVMVAENWDKKNSGSDKYNMDLASYTILSRVASDRKAGVDRLAILTEFFLKDNPDVVIKDTKRFFDDDVRYAVWFRDGKKCTHCKKSIDFSDAIIHHVVDHAKGGETLMTNAKCMCDRCHAKKGSL